MSDYQPNEAEKLLIAALRGGGYQQAREMLRDGGKFCCLGVACDLYANTTRLGNWTNFEGFRTGDVERYDVLTEPVREWLGWKTDSGDVLSGSLSQMNDDGATFSEIADIIERGEVLRAEPGK